MKTHGFAFAFCFSLLVLLSACSGDNVNAPIQLKKKLSSVECFVKDTVDPDVLLVIHLPDSLTRYRKVWQFGDGQYLVAYDSLARHIYVDRAVFTAVVTVIDPVTNGVSLIDTCEVDLRLKPFNVAILDQIKHISISFESAFNPFTRLSPSGRVTLQNATRPFQGTYSYHREDELSGSWTYTRIQLALLEDGSSITAGELYDSVGYKITYDDYDTYLTELTMHDVPLQWFNDSLVVYRLKDQAMVKSLSRFQYYYYNSQRSYGRKHFDTSSLDSLQNGVLTIALSR